MDADRAPDLGATLLGLYADALPVVYGDRAALTLRHLDGLSVPEVATVLGRTVHATEALLVRARNAFRASYEIQAQRFSNE
jgi:DNA-directed RNA polymerase specialized sigma24 family protein